MKKQTSDSNKDEKCFPGYPSYPAHDDIYYTDKKVNNINPDDNSIIKVEKEKVGKWNEKGYDDLLTGDDLDVPDNEFDGSKDSPGIEDEENNYYSLGGDDHNDLEEDRLEYPRFII